MNYQLWRHEDSDKIDQLWAIGKEHLELVAQISNGRRDRTTSDEEASALTERIKALRVQRKEIMKTIGLEVE